MATDVPDANTSRDSSAPLPDAVAAWTEARIDTGVLWVLLGVLALESAALGLCLWVLAVRDAAPLYVSQGG
jgi:hypothetical protein